MATSGSVVNPSPEYKHASYPAAFTASVNEKVLDSAGQAKFVESLFGVAA